MPEHIKNIDVLMNPKERNERQRLKNESMLRYDEQFGSLDMDKSYNALFELLWYSQMPCFDVKDLTSKAKDELSFLKRCFWKERLISCHEIFEQRPTDQGMCCSFNMKKADQVLKTGRYTEAISARQSRDTESAFETKAVPPCYKDNQEPIPEAGRNKGLTLIIDGHSNKVSAGTVKENFNGFTTLVDDKHKFPLLSVTSLISRPGYESNIKVDAIKLEAKNEVRKYAPVRRNCYFPDEYKLKIHQKYSQFNCIFECKAEFASKCLSTCDELGQECTCDDVDTINNMTLEKTKSCVPWYYPTNPKGFQTFCDPWDTEKFLQVIKNEIPKKQCQYCLPDCNTTKYETSIAYAELRGCDRTNLGGTSMLCSLVDGQFNPTPWMATAQKDFKNANLTIPWYLNTNSSQISKTADFMRFPNQRLRIPEEREKSNLIFFSELEGEQTYDAFKKDIGIVNIFFSDEKILRYMTANTMSDLDFLSQIGGSLGLSMGVSIISVIEIIYWFTILFFRNY